MPEGVETLDGETAPAKYLTAIALQPDIERAIEVTRDADGSFTGRETMREFTEGFVRAAGTIDNSLFLDGERAGLPPQIIVEMIRMYSYSVDFQREIQPGDKFEVYFEPQVRRRITLPLKKAMCFSPRSRSAARRTSSGVTIRATASGTISTRTARA